MTNLPVLFSHTGPTLVVDTTTGEALELRDASDHTLAAAAEEIAALDRRVFAAKRALAFELQTRYGTGKVSAGGYTLTVAESTSWPLRATQDALDELLAAGKITDGDQARCLPLVAKPAPVALKALVGRLMLKDPAWAKVLSDACTVSPPSLRDVKPAAVDVDVAA